MSISNDKIIIAFKNSNPKLLKSILSILSIPAQLNLQNMISNYSNINLPVRNTARNAITYEISNSVIDGKNYIIVDLIKQPDGPFETLIISALQNIPETYRISSIILIQTGKQCRFDIPHIAKTNRKISRENINNSENLHFEAFSVKKCFNLDISDYVFIKDSINLKDQNLYKRIEEDWNTFTTNFLSILSKIKINQKIENIMTVLNQLQYIRELIGERSSLIMSLKSNRKRITELDQEKVQNENSMKLSENYLEDDIVDDLEYQDGENLNNVCDSCCKICHKDCGIGEATLGNNSIKSCASMDGEICKECGCSYLKHYIGRRVPIRTKNTIKKENEVLKKKYEEYKSNIDQINKELSKLIKETSPEEIKNFENKITEEIKTLRRGKSYDIVGDIKEMTKRCSDSLNMTDKQKYFGIIESEIKFLNSARRPFLDFFL